VGLHNTYFVVYANVISAKSPLSRFKISLASTDALRYVMNVLASEIVIGKNVWITSRVFNHRSVRIGRHPVIGAGSVASKDIPPKALLGEANQGDRPGDKGLRQTQVLRF
jgi:acetyltransferase-like isoleucine patch superfamily enzyme